MATNLGLQKMHPLYSPRMCYLFLFLNPFEGTDYWQVNLNCLVSHVTCGKKSFFHDLWFLNLESVWYRISLSLPLLMLILTTFYSALRKSDFGEVNLTLSSYTVPTLCIPWVQFKQYSNVRFSSFVLIEATAMIHYPYI